VPTQDRIEKSIEAPADTAADETPRVNTAEIEDIGRFGYEPLIDEPVTGSGNDDLWVPDCDPDKQGACPDRPSSPPPGDKSE
jgi:hypothetical protein